MASYLHYVACGACGYAVWGVAQLHMSVDEPGTCASYQREGRPGSKGKEDPFADLGIALEKFCNE